MNKMRVVQGNKLVELLSLDFGKLIRKYSEIRIDIGAGDGGFVYKNAKNDPEILWIGIDPVEKQLRKFSRKAVRNKVDNVLFVVGSVEMLDEVFGNYKDFVAKIYILFPWGSLLKQTVQPDEEILKNYHRLLIPGGKIEIILGYSKSAEPSEINRLDLDKLDQELLKEKTIPAYKKSGLTSNKVERVNKENLRKLETSWRKRLKYSDTRPVYYLEFEKERDSE